MLSDWSDAVKPPSSLAVSGNIITELVVDNIGFIGGSVGIGRAIAEGGLGTYRTECVIGTFPLEFCLEFCLELKKLTREVVAPTTTSSVERETIGASLILLTIEPDEEVGWLEHRSELAGFGMSVGVDLEVACKAAARDGEASDRRGVFVSISFIWLYDVAPSAK